MDKKRLLKISGILLLISATLYALQIIIFHQEETTLFNILQDFAFMPLTILIATVFIGSMMEQKDREQRMEQTRMLKSAFFSDIGNELMWQMVTRTDNDREFLRLVHSSAHGVSNEDVEKAVDGMSFTFEEAVDMLDAIGAILSDHRQTMYLIASNPAMLEHELFTDMLWALFHMNDEVTLRQGAKTQKKDVENMEQDIKRVLKLLLLNWFSHMDYMKQEYPYYYKTSLDKMFGELKRRFGEKARQRRQAAAQRKEENDDV